VVNVPAIRPPIANLARGEYLTNGTRLVQVARIDEKLGVVLAEDCSTLVGVEIRFTALPDWRHVEPAVPVLEPA
jgi:hypothetical protein